MSTERPPKRNTDLLARRQAAIPRGLSQSHQIIVARAVNAELWDVEGRRYIDFCSGIAVVNTGHCHPQVIGAVSKQLERFTHTCFQVIAYEPYIALAERLNALAPGNAPKKTFFMSTGAEAIENAVKIARAATRRPGDYCIHRRLPRSDDDGPGAHRQGRSYKAGFGPFPNEVYHAPFPCPLHDTSVDDAIAGIETLFKNDVEPARVAAIVVEPVQGEGGYYPAPAEFLPRLRALCDRHGMLLIADEVQTGIGRTGKMFAVEHYGVIPDIIALAKGLGGGFPISAIVGREDVMDAVGPGGLGGTYAGSPIACAAALAVLDILEREQLLEQSRKLGEHLQSRLRALATRHPAIGDVRGLGLMVAIEFFNDAARREPAPELAKAVVAEAARRGLLLLSCGVYGNVIRIMTPLTIPDTVLDEGLCLLEDTVAAVSPVMA